MLITRFLLLAVLVCAVGLTSGENAQHRQVRSLIPPTVQRMAQKTGEKVVEAGASVARAFGLYPAKNDTSDDDTNASDSDGGPLSLIKEIPLKIITVVQGTQEEHNSTSASAASEESESASAESDEKAAPVSVKLRVQPKEVSVEELEPEDDAADPVAEDDNASAAAHEDEEAENPAPDADPVAPAAAEAGEGAEDDGAGEV